ncbi:MAG: site-specific DNA-methyltransferase [Pirellulaceae bacterium]|nr:site-specific DNA-methyltransferase [Pirellulaceae bacterium]
MNARNARLELIWIDKDFRPRLEPRVLLEDPSRSILADYRHGDKDRFDNRLIFGDNLLALKALQQEFASKVKCIYIDPPYNTGSAFEHYDDGVEHSVWLGLMRDRLELLKELLRDDGVIFVHIDDNEHAYLKVLMDEIFGRRNFCGQFIWEKKKKPSFLNANMGVVTEYILAYSPNRSKSPAFIGGLTTEGKKYPLNNAGNSVQTLKFPAKSVQFVCDDQVIEPQDMSGGNIITKLLDRLEVRGGTNASCFRLEGEWRYSQKKLDSIIAAGEKLVISKVPFRPNHVKAGGEEKKIKNLLSISHFQMATYEDSNAESAALFGDTPFDYPSPLKVNNIGRNPLTIEPRGGEKARTVLPLSGRHWDGNTRGRSAICSFVGKPNIIVIVTDGLGYIDLGAQGILKALRV